MKKKYSSYNVDNIILTFYLTRNVNKEQTLIYNDGLPGNCLVQGQKYRCLPSPLRDSTQQPFGYWSNALVVTCLVVRLNLTRQWGEGYYDYGLAPRIQVLVLVSLVWLVYYYYWGCHIKHRIHSIVSDKSLSNTTTNVCVNNCILPYQSSFVACVCIFRNITSHSVSKKK